MELWLDGVDLEAVDHAKELGLLHGVTTNPSILAQRSPKKVLTELLKRFSGPIAIQVTARTAAEMVEEGKDLAEYTSRVIVKVPATEEGIEAIAKLTHSEIPTMGTVVFTPLQAFLAAQAGARYIAPYFSHIGESAFEVTQAIHDLLKLHQLPAKLCVAALKTPDQVQECVVRGYRSVTLKPDLFKKCLTPPSQVREQLERFDALLTG
ncbi:MAG: Fructose-6-phosphate aldolase 1 [Chlamydiales bacterium]|nr:Fructose-6-phosphate aldolase 1 [Chlamydiales bacterium]